MTTGFDPQCGVQLGFLLIGGALATAAVPVQEALSLGKRDTRLLVQQACDRATGVDEAEVHAWRLPAPARKLTATVFCPLLAPVQQLPAFQARSCQQLPSKAWRCDETRDAFRLPVGTRSALIMYRVDAVAADTAIEMARFAALDYRITFNGRNLSEMLLNAQHCEVSAAGKGVFPDSANHLIQCGRLGVVITKDCTRRPCRLFPAALRDIR